MHTPFPLPVFCVFHSRTNILLCCSSSLLFCCVSIAFLRFGLCFGYSAVAVMLFRAVFHLMSWASLWAYVCSPSASIRLTFPFSAHKQSTTSPCTRLVSLPFRSDPMILRRKGFPTFQRQSIALCFNHHSDSLECKAVKPPIQSPPRWNFQLSGSAILHSFPYFLFFCSHHKDTFALFIAFSLIIHGLILHIFSAAPFVLYANRIFL